MPQQVGNADWIVPDDDYVSHILFRWWATVFKTNLVEVMMQFPSQVRGTKSRAVFDELTNQFF